jgi:hypothetical protein
METGVKRSSAGLMAGIAAAALVIGIFGADTIKGFFSRNSAEAVGLLTVKDMNRIHVLQASFAAVVTTQTEPDWPIPAAFLRKTTIMIGRGDVGYFVDMAQLSEANVAWNEEQQQLLVTVPAPLSDKPNVDMRQVKTYVEGTTLPWNDKVSEVARNANQDKIYAAIERQARNPAMIKLAQAAAEKAISANLMLALRNKDYDKATVKIVFAP